MAKRIGLVIAIYFGIAVPVFAVQVEQLDPARDLEIVDVEILGSEVFSEGALLNEIITTKRPWYTPWRSRPVFQPDTFATDLVRLRRFYETHGYYETEIVHDLELDAEGGVVVRFWVKESAPVIVGKVEAGVKDEEQLPLPEELPIQPGEIFTEPTYQEGETTLMAFFLERARPHVHVAREAKIDLVTRRADVRYIVTPSEEAQYGEIRVTGNEDIPPWVILREVEWEEREPFHLEDIKYTRENLLGLELFRSVKIGWEKTENPAVVPMVIEVREKPPRDIRVGVGYGTEDQFRAQFRWEHNNWLGGARELVFDVKYSAIKSSVGAKFTQPHFPMRWTRSILEFRQDQDDEDTYLLWASRLKPRLERRFLRTLTGVLGFNLAWLKFDDIADETVAAIGAVRDEGLTFGPTIGLVWNTTDNILDPKLGHVVSLFADETGGFAGGDYRYWKTALEGKRYQAVGWDTILAGRLYLGTTDDLGSVEDLPLSERFYAGGEKSVRGYGRRRLGPKSSADDPIGGRSLVEGSIEARRPIWGGLGGALWLDFGQVSLDVFDFPFGDLDYSVGPGFYYATPVGPIRLDVGFPLDPPPGDSTWRIHFSIGQFF